MCFAPAESGDKSVPLGDDGYANFFFVHSGISVFVLRVCRDSDGCWDVVIFRLDGGYGWNAGSSLVARN